MKILVIGDVHGKIDDLIEIIESTDCANFIQLGDLGFAKHWDQLIKYLRNRKWANKPEIYFRLIPGNHDDYTKLHVKTDNTTKWMRTGSIKVDNVWIEGEFFGVRGADSIDKHLRTEGISWWLTEEMNYNELGKAIDLYIHYKPKYMFSHDCPQSVMEQLFGYKDKSRTRQALQQMFELHQPEYHFFGHHHKAIDEVINGTRFICLPELATFELEIL